MPVKDRPERRGIGLEGAEEALIHPESALHPEACRCLPSTLDAWYRCAGSIPATAEHLSHHRNTVLPRPHRVEHLVGRSLRHPAHVAPARSVPWRRTRARTTRSYGANPEGGQGPRPHVRPVPEDQGCLGRGLRAVDLRLLLPRCPLAR
ncbi:helix-turn-helix domain-containing protein [Embleya sp. NPDC005575]|uniref:helix-turn-helix domain-containing protein n=1 Tax=Embleya sp. NPDC005575 TaxID=3156892 RepID=UPI0033B751BC